MNITRENIDELNGLIRISIEKADYEPSVEASLSEYRKKAKLPGFRPGKIPVGLVKKMYGKAALVEEINKILSSSLSKYLVDEKLDILGEPLPNETQQKTIDWDNASDFEFLFDIGFAPEVKISFDKRSKYPYYKVQVSEDMIDQQVEAYANRFGNNEPADVVELKDTVKGDIAQLNADGTVNSEGISVEMALISIDVIKDEEIRNSFVGKKVGDEVIFDIKKAYSNDTEIAYILNIDKVEAATIEGNFKIAIKEIHSFVPAIVNEDLFKKVYGEETTIADDKAFRAQIAEEITESYKASSEYKFLIDTREALISKNKMDFPENFLKRWLLAVNKELSQTDIEAEFGHFVEDLKWQIVKEKIVKENELKVEEADVVEMAKEVAAAQFRQYGMFNIPAEHLDGFAQQILQKKEDRNRLYNRKLDEKIMEVVKLKATVEEKEISKEEFEKLFA